MTTFLNSMPRIHIHPILVIFMMIAFLTGTFMEFSIILFIVCFHELGHFLMARHFQWRIRSVMLWFFGGVMDTDEHGNKPIREEILVTIAGPLQHLLIYFLLFFLFSFSNVPVSILKSILYYNTIIFAFNLLPIWPLDGGKLLFYLLSSFFPFKRAYNITLLFSIAASIVFLIVILFFLPFNLSTFFIIVFLLHENRLDWNRRFYVFIRFLLRRYEGNFSYKSIYPLIVHYHYPFMDVFSQFYREKKHPIYIILTDGSKHKVDEKECLQHYFRHHQNKRIGEIISQH